MRWRLVVGFVVTALALGFLWPVFQGRNEIVVVVDTPRYDPLIFDPSDLDAAIFFTESHPNTRISIRPRYYALEPETGRLMFQEEQKKGVQFFVTTQPSQSLRASLDLFQGGQHLLLNTSATTAEASGLDDFILRIIPDLREEQAFIARHIASTGAKRILVLIDAGNPAYASNAYGHFREHLLAKGGVELRAHEVFFRNLQLKEFDTLFNQPIDLLYILGSDFQSGIGNVAQLFHLRHPQAPIVLTPWARSGAIFDTAGPALRRTVLISHHATRGQEPVLDRYLKDFQARFGYEPNYMAIKVRQALELLHQAIENGHDSPAAVKAYLLAGKSHTTSLGEIHFDATGDQLGGFHIITSFD